MRLLFDSNLSHRLKEILGDVYPDSVHVREVGLESAVTRCSFPQTVTGCTHTGAFNWR